MTTTGRDIASLLTHWYHKSKRVLPWRQTDDPYKIWISEIMLQQTQVDTVIPYYNRFIATLPTVFDLAKADEDQVFKLWEGLGYYSRARNLMGAARVIVDQFNGVMPSHYHQIIQLPGIGPYTAGAILSIAFGQKVAAVDGNVMRVYGRLKQSELDIANPKCRKTFEAYVLADMGDDSSGFTQGLMELGALICTPKSPKCTQCPVSDFCLAYAHGQVHLYPVKSKKAKQSEHHMLVIFCHACDQVLLIKKNDSGLLSGLWGFPVVDQTEPLLEAVNLYMSTTFNVTANQLTLGKTAKHIFTHRIWKMQRVDIEVTEPFQVDYPEMQWIDLNDLGHYPLSTALKKLLD